VNEKGSPVNQEESLVEQERLAGVHDGRIENPREPRVEPGGVSAVVERGRLMA